MPMRKVFVLGLVLLLTGATAASAQVRTIALAAEEPGLEVRQLAGGDYAVTVTVGEIRHFDVATPAGTFTQLAIPGFHQSSRIGAPQLPMMNRLVALPFGATATVTIEDVQTRTVDLAAQGITHPLMPAQPSLAKNQDPADVPFAYDRGAYQGPARAADALVRVVAQGRLRAIDVGRLEVAPVSYDPVAGTLEVAERITCRVSFRGGDPTAGRDLALRTHSSFFAPVYSKIEGARGLHDSHPDLVRDVVSYVIVTPPMFTAQLADFVQWKTERGFHVTVGEIGSPEVGSTASSIQAYIHGLFENATPEQPAPSFVLFVGDVAQCPTFQVSGDATDRPYCAVDGDYLPDIYYGRFSATNTSQLQAILDKTMMYDQYAMPDPSYLEKVVLIAGMDSYFGGTHANGQINYGSSNYFDAAHGIAPDIHLYPQSGSQAAQIVSEVSEGRAFVNYTAHGSQTSWADPSFTQSNINGLHNDGKYGLVIGNCCLTGSYDYPECFGETWLRAPNKGAIGYIGGSNNTLWNEDFWWGVGYTSNITANPTFAATETGAYDGMFHDHGEAEDQWYVCQDAVIFCGNLAVQESGSGSTSYYWNIYNLQGDPSIVPYLGVPEANPVDHPANLVANFTEMTVAGAAGSYVGVTQNGVLLGAGTIHADRSPVTIAFAEQLVPGQPVKLVVMAQNHEPYVAEIPVAAAATISVVPETVPAGVPTAVTVTVLENDGVTPIPDVAVTVTEPTGLIGNVVSGTTDASGVAVLTVDYAWGADLLMAGTHPTEGFMFDRVLPAVGTPLADPDLTVLTEPGMHDVFALNLPGTLTATSGTPDITLTAWVPGSGWFQSATGSLEVTPAAPGEVHAWILKTGCDIYEEIFPVVTEPSLHGQVTLAGEADHSGVTVTATPGDYSTVTAVDGTWNLLNLEPGTYTVTAAKDGWSTGIAEVTVAEGEHPTGIDFTLSVVYTAEACAQPEIAIPDWPGGPVLSTATIAESGAVDWVRIHVDITHPYRGNLEVQLISPAGTTVMLHYRSGGYLDDLVGWYPDELTPYGDLDDLHGEPITGEWTLSVQDQASGSVGTLHQWCVQIGYAGGVVAVGEPALPSRLALGANYPNPFNPSTTIGFALPRTADVSLQVFDLRGRQIATLVQGELPAGRHEVVWTGRDRDGRQAASGLYVYRLVAGGEVMSRKMLLLK